MCVYVSVPVCACVCLCGVKCRVDIIAACIIYYVSVCFCYSQVVLDCIPVFSGSQLRGVIFKPLPFNWEAADSAAIYFCNGSVLRGHGRYGNPGSVLRGLGRGGSISAPTSRISA